MNIRNRIKNSKYGIIFAIIGLIFAGISSAFATTYESTNTTMTTTYNSNVSNVYGAISDLYSIYGSVPRLSAADRYGMVSYKYWNVTGSIISRAWPTTSYDSVADLASSSDLSDYPVYIRTVLTGNYVSNHEVCIRYNSIDACIPMDLWAGDLNDNTVQAAADATKMRVKRFFESTMGLQVNTCVSSTPSFGGCIYGNNVINIQANYMGKVQITYYNATLNASRRCDVYPSGTTPRASCTQYS